MAVVSCDFTINFVDVRTTRHQEIYGNDPKTMIELAQIMDADSRFSDIVLTRRGQKKTVTFQRQENNAA
jgi:hypothetical protein